MSEPGSPALPDEQFASMEQQAHAARLGMWVFLASEVLLFGVLFALFASYRFRSPSAFHEAMTDNTRVLGSINTGLLLVSSILLASGAHALRAGRRRVALSLVAGTMTLGAAFLVIKLCEYRQHFREGIYPGGSGRYFEAHASAGFSEFWTLYYAMTGLHAIHIVVGLLVLGAAIAGMIGGRVAASSSYRLEVSALYWHLVDLIWIFLWPLFYLA